MPELLDERLPGGQLTVGPHYLPESEVQGLLLDFDGTLVDSMPIFYPAWPATCEALSLPRMERTQFYGFAGVPMRAIIREIYQDEHGEECPTAFVDAFMQQHKATAEGLEKTMGLPPRIECVIALAERARAAGLPVALATSGEKSFVLRHLAHSGLDDMFSDELGNLVVAADVAAGKPEPDIYLEAARRIGVEPSRCRAYEDGESGLLAAYRAGCHVIDVTGMDGYPAPEELRVAKAAQVAARDWLPSDDAARGRL